MFLSYYYHKKREREKAKNIASKARAKLKKLESIISILKERGVDDKIIKEAEEIHAKEEIYVISEIMSEKEFRKELIQRIGNIEAKVDKLTEEKNK